MSLLVLVLAHYDQGSYITIYYWNTCLCSFVSSTLLKNEEQQSLFFAAPLLSHGGKVKFDCSHPCVQGRGCESTCRHIVLDGDWVTFLWGGVTERERLYFQQALSHWHETSRTINPLVWALFCLNSALCKFLDLRLVICASQGLQMQINLNLNPDLNLRPMRPLSSLMPLAGHEYDNNCKRMVFVIAITLSSSVHVA